MLKNETVTNRWSEFFDLMIKTKLNIKLFVIALLISSIGTITSTFIPNFLKGFIDSYANFESFSMKGIKWLIILFLFSTLAATISSYLLGMVGMQIVANLRNIVWSKIAKLPSQFYDVNESGDLASRVVNDTTVIFNLISSSLSKFISAILTILFCTFWLFYYDWQLAIIAITAIPLLLMFFIPLGKILAKLSKTSQRLTAKLNVTAFEMLSEIKLIKAHTAERQQIHNGKENIEQLKAVGIKQVKWTSIINPVLNFIMMMVIFTIIGYGGMKLANGKLSPGTFIAFLTLLFYLIGPISNLGIFLTELQKTKGATERIIEILREEKEHLMQGEHLIEFDRDIKFHNVHFNYQAQNKSSFSLQSINLKVKGGKTIALVGPSGSGKTTLMSLIERFYKPTSGQIIIDDKNIEDFSLFSWRNQIGYVSQEHSLITGTIRDNLVLGINKEEIDEGNLIWACKLAYAWDFIKELPNGLDTHIGEKGLNLSGGQRQRIAIARMFLKRPKMILLDEATANLDSESEEKVQLAIKKLTSGRTAIIIAHRLSTVMNSDQIVFLENGRITGQGTHDELLMTHKIYEKFCKHQLISSANKITELHG